MFIKTSLKIILLLSLSLSQRTVAILDFEARGINTLEAATLTDRFTSEMAKTGAVRLVERNMVDEILTEQGFQQSGCTSDECAVEVGALLGVQYMLSGSIGKLGETYTIDAKMVSIETGATTESRNVTYIGKVDGLVTEIEILSWDILGLKPPEALLEKKRLGAQAFLAASAKKKTRMGALLRSAFIPGLGQYYADKKITGFGFLVTELAIVGLYASANSAYHTATDDFINYQNLYNIERDPVMIAEYRAKVNTSHDDIKSNKDLMNQMAMAAGGVWAINAIHAFLVKPKNVSASKDQKVDLVYDPFTQSPKLRFSIALD
tara:strand:- start:684 stop:1643 length:960 start_codon:yes stop_codon:yes gene_type:complete